MFQEKIYDKRSLRLMIEGMLCRTGCPWRDAPDYFGRWNSICTKFNQWPKKGKWLSVFKTLSKNTDTEWEFIDGTYVKAHQKYHIENVISFSEIQIQPLHIFPIFFCI